MRLLHLKERYHLIHGMVHSNTLNGTIQYVGWYRLMYWKVPFVYPIIIPASPKSPASAE